MKCKTCGAEYPDGEKCPVCSGAQKNGKPSNAGRIVLTIVLCVVIVAAIVCILGFTLGWFHGEDTAKTDPSASLDASEPTDPSQSTDPSGSDPADFTAPADGDASKVTAKSSYATADAKPGDADMTAAVATFDGGTLTNGELNVYLWMAYYDFMNTYGSYAPYFGLDANTPLHLQASMAPANEEDENSGYMSWEQYFLQTAAENYRYYKGLELTAKAEGFVLPEDYQKDLDAIHENLEEAAEQSGYDSVETYLQKSFGTGTTEADFLSYQTTFITAYAYFEEVLSNSITPTDEEITAYFDENAASFEERHITKTDLVDRAIRHILIKTEADVDSDGDGKNDTCSDEVIAEAKAKAEEIYAKWQEDPTEEHFAELAKENSADGNAAQGGIYEDVYYGMMVDAFNDWCFDESRQVGDHGIVQTPFGFHVMYFSAFNDNYYWFDAAKEALVGEKAQEKSQELVDKQTITFDFSKAVICDVVSDNVAVSE